MHKDILLATRKWIFRAFKDDLCELSWILQHPVSDDDVDKLASTHLAFLMLMDPF